MKKIDLDFTSLLDIMLILLFVFLLNSNAENIEKEETVNAQIRELQKEQTETVQNLLSVEAENQLLKAEINEKEEQLDNIQSQLEQALSAPRQSRQTWHNYKTIAQKFHFINVRIAAPNNQLYINETAYPLFISSEEAQDHELRLAKRKEIENILEKEIDQKKGGYQFVLLSSGKDLRIPRLVYTLLWDAIKEVERKYGTEKVFKTEVYWE